MNDQPTGSARSFSWFAHNRAAAVAITVSAVYCLIFLARPPSSWPLWLRRGWRLPSTWIQRLIDQAWHVVSSEPASRELRWALYFLLVSCVVPWLVLALCRRGRPYDLGLRMPNRYGWRLVTLSFLIAFPFVGWMAHGQGFAGPYLKKLDRAGSVGFCLFYFITMLTEHFLFHGVLLSVGRADRRWPKPATTEYIQGAGFVGVLRWFGLAQPTNGTRGLRYVTRWIGLPDGCLLAAVTSAALFGLIHMGKAPRELVLSLPGGLALSYLAYRTNSWLVPFMLHLATAGTAVLIILIERG